MEKKLDSKVDYKWLYNLQEDRFYEYQELKDRRELNPFPNQMNRSHIQLNEERVRYFRENILRNPDTYRIPYEDPELFMPEAFMPKEIKESELGRNYNQALDDLAEEANSSTFGEEDEEDGGEDVNVREPGEEPLETFWLAKSSRRL